MDPAELDVKKRSFCLKPGTYLIRGPGALNLEGEHSLHIDNDSVDEKHALIIAETDGIFVYDLDTRMGTFVNEQRLPALSKLSISRNSVIRFGTVGGKLNKCSEQHHSSGFCDESLHLALDLSNEAENLTIPETQCVNPEEQIFACESDSNRNTSNDSTIPETQEVLQLPVTLIPKSTLLPPPTENSQHQMSSECDMGSQFDISTQDYLNHSSNSDSNSINFIENAHWLNSDEQPTAIKQDVKWTEREQPLCRSKSDEGSRNPGKIWEMAQEAIQMEIDVQDEDLLRSQTHTPDLFDAALLEDFEKREARMIIARTIASQNDDSLAKEDKSTNKQVNEDEPDLFEGVILQNEEDENDKFNAPPLQLSNKENMVVSAATLADLIPTQAFVSKKAMQPPEVLPPKNTTSTHSLLVGSDFVPTQIFLSKKANNEDSLKSSTPKMKAATVDLKDLEPTQTFVPKNSTKKISKSVPDTKHEVINLNSTMVPNAQNEHDKRTPRSFFAELDGSVHDEQQKSCANLSKNLPQAPILLTPELISNTFAKQNVPDTESRQELLSRLESNSESEDSLTRLLTYPRISSDFDSLIDSIKKLEESPNKQNNKEQNELLQKYIDTKKSENPQKAQKFGENKPTHLENEDNSKPSLSSKSSKSETIQKKQKLNKKNRDQLDNEHGSSSRSLRRKRNASEDLIVDNKRLKTKRNDDERVLNDEKSSSTNNKGKIETDKKSEEEEVKRNRQKRNAIIDKPIAIDSKIIKIKTNSTESEASSLSPMATEIAAKHIKSSSDCLKQSVDKKVNRVRKTSNSSSSSAVNKASLKINNSGTATKIAKTDSERRIMPRTSSRLRSQSSNSSVYSIQESTKKDNDKPSQITKKRAVSRKRNLETIDSLSDSATASDGDSAKNIKSRKNRKNPNQKQETNEEPKIILNSSIKAVKVKRTRSRPPGTVVSSQTVEPKNDNKDEVPTTSKTAAAAPAKNIVTNELKTAKKAALKLAFTMVEPEKKAELLKHANNKWEEVKDAVDSEILIMDTGNRTLKFLIAVAKGIPIVTSKWLEAIKTTGVISVRSNYFFKDAAFERSFKFSLLHTLSEAKKAKLFTNFEFLLTKNIVPTQNDMKMIVISAGGTILEKENIPDKKENQQLYLISSGKDRQHWHSYRRKNANLCITSTEAVMLAVMRYDATLLEKQCF